METESNHAPRVARDAQVVDSRLGRWTRVEVRSMLVECELGDYSYVMNDSDLMYARLGKFVSVASHVRVNPSNHPLWRPALHHFTYRSGEYGFGPDDGALFDWRRADAVDIGHDAWLGHGAVVLPGVRVGVGAVLGAGCVAVRDVADFAVVVGNPAREVRRRFDEDVRRALLEIAWWDWDHERLGRALEDFRTRDVRDFVAKYRP